MRAEHDAVDSIRLGAEAVTFGLEPSPELFDEAIAAVDAVADLAIKPQFSGVLVGSG
jgi:hypothetical protein